MATLPTALLAYPASADRGTDQHDRRRQTDRRRGTQERRQLILKFAPADDRRAGLDERRSGLDRRVEWADPPPRRFPIEQHLVKNTAATGSARSSICTLEPAATRGRAVVTRSLILIRHGQIAANARGRWHGSTDSPLNRVGRRQVSRIAERVHKEWGDLAAIYSSPLMRCLNTAQAIGKRLGRDVVVDDDLREYGIGELEDTPFAALQAEHDFFRRIRKTRSLRLPAAIRSAALPGASCRHCAESIPRTTRRGRLWSSVTARRLALHWPHCLTLTRIAGHTTKSTTAASPNCC